MRILLANWAPIWQGHAQGGGVSVYNQSLALELIRLGHEVAAVSSGGTYTPAVPGSNEPGRCGPRRHPDWLGVRVYEIVNSPVLAPSLDQFAEPDAEVSSPELEAAFDQVLAACEPDILHVQSLEGFSLGCLDRARDHGARLVLSLHNYHIICPQVYLLQNHRYPCHSAEGGRTCATCLKATDPSEIRRARVRSFVERTTPNRDDREPPSRRALARALFGSFFPPRRSPPNPAPLPGVAIDDDPAPASKPDTRGTTQLLLGDTRPSPEPDPRDLVSLTNTIAAEPPPDTSTPYGRRRRAMLDALSACDAVHAVSDFVADKFAALGVDREANRTIPIGTRATRIAANQPELIFDPPPFGPPDARRPLRIVFMGSAHWAKGLPMLIDSLELLSPDTLGALDLTVYAADIDVLSWRLKRLEPRLAALTIGGAYTPHDVPWMCSGKDLGVVPSVWWDNGPQTVLEFQACGLPVLAAAVGGIPDRITHDRDGYLFETNNRESLADALWTIVADPERISRWRRSVEPPKSIETHAAEMADLYHALVNPKPERAAT